MYQLPKCSNLYFSYTLAGVLFEGAFSLWVSLKSMFTCIHYIHPWNLPIYYSKQYVRLNMINFNQLQTLLTNFWPIFSFYISWKQQKTFRKPVFRWFKVEPWARNGSKKKKWIHELSYVIQTNYSMITVSFIYNRSKHDTCPNIMIPQSTQNDITLM